MSPSYGYDSQAVPACVEKADQLQAKEARQILGLNDKPTQDEVKAAFRDMVKVWHPDRFGSDPRLRLKAEQKLKDINDAYRTLRDGGTETQLPFSEPDSDPGVETRQQSSPKEKRVAITAVLLYAFAGFLFVAAASYVFLLLRSVNQRTSATVADAIAPAKSTATPKIVPTKQPRAPEAKHARLSGVRSDATETPSFEVLTETETAQVQAACWQKRHNGSAYTACIRTELARIRRYELATSALTAEEKDSVSTACSSETARRDDSGYARCAAFYKQELAKVPDRPNMAVLSETDRNAADAACAKRKFDGPAQYDRCLMRFVRLLAH